jgi:hypothetical protein
MNRFQNGKIYKITSSAGKPYIGSTCISLKSRFHLHFKNGHTYSVSPHLEKDDIKIELIEKYPCNNREELIKRERYWTEQIECCNKRKPYRSYKEQIAYQVEYFRTDYWRNYQKEYQEKYHKTRFLRALPFFRI